MKLGFTIYNFHSIMKTIDDVDKVLNYLHQMGVNTVQISGTGNISNYEIADICKKYNLEVCLTHMPYDRIINDTEELIKEHFALGCDTIGLGSIPDKYKSIDGAAQFLKELNPACERMKSSGINFAYHNHHFEFERFQNGRRLIDILIEDSNPELFTFIPDIHWLQTGGVNPCEFLDRISGRSKVCHFKDYKIIKNEEGKYERAFAEIGTGNINLDACYQACIKNGIEYIMIEQDSTDIDIFESAKISWSNLNKISERNS